EIRDASSTVLDSATFTKSLGAAGDGNTLNRTAAGESFAPHTPTPGAAMSSEVIAPKAKPLPPVKAAAAPKKSSGSTKTAKVDEDPTATTTSDAAPESQVAAAAQITPSTAPWEWYVAAGVLALASAGAVVFARRYAKDEWDIVDESDS